MNKSFQIKHIFYKLMLMLTILTLLTGCSLAPSYIDPETGELEAQAARISLLKKTSIKTLYSTETNVFYLMNNGTLLASGSNEKGLLGQGNYNEYDYVVQTKLEERIKIVTANESMAAAVSDTNTIYIWGDLSWWESDHNTDTDKNGDEKLECKIFEFREIITDISVSESHIAVLTKTGNVYTLGYNNGQLGYDSAEPNGEFYPEFRRVETDVFVSKIETNPTTTYMLSNSGVIYACGKNENYEMGYIDNIQTVNAIENTTVFTSIATAGNNLFALSNSGEVYVCGQNQKGVLGLNSTLTHAAALTRLPLDGIVVSIVGNDYRNNIHFVMEDGTVYACGDNSDGSLCTADSNAEVIAPSPVKIVKVTQFYGTGAAKFFLDEKGRLYTYGSNAYNQMPASVISNKNVITPVRIYANIK